MEREEVSNYNKVRLQMDEGRETYFDLSGDTMCCCDDMLSNMNFRCREVSYCFIQEYTIPYKQPAGVLEQVLCCNILDIPATSVNGSES